MDSARNEATIGLPPGMLMILAVCLAICSMGCCIKKSQRTVSTPTIASSSTQQNANRRQNSARRYMSRDAELEIIQKMSVSDRKLFLTNALKTDVYKTSSTQSSSGGEPMLNALAHDSCPICLDPFHEGDSICASPNNACSHVFHQHCVFDWLLTHEICPICRRNYLQLDIVSSVLHENRDDDDVMERGDPIDPSVLHPVSSSSDDIMTADQTPFVDDSRDHQLPR
jgi:hypothetical protein